MLDNGQAWLTTNKRDRDLLNTDADNVAKYMCSYTPQPVLLQPAMAPVSQELRAEEEAVSQLRVQVRMAEEAAALSWPGLQLQQQGRCTSIVEEDACVAAARAAPPLQRPTRLLKVTLREMPSPRGCPREAQGALPPPQTSPAPTPAPAPRPGLLTYASPLAQGRPLRSGRRARVPWVPWRG